MIDTDLIVNRWKFQTNLNGDTPETLRDEFDEVRELAARLQDAILKITVHGRNYQTLDATDLKHDLEEGRVMDARERGYKADLALKQQMYRQAEEISRAATAGQLRAMQQVKEDV